MSTKEYLLQAFILKNLIKAKRSRIQELRDRQTWVGAMLSEVNVKSSPKHDRMGDLLATILDLEEECLKDVVRLQDIEIEIKNLIEAINNADCRLILYERYINLKRWATVAIDAGYSERQVHNLHEQGLRLIELHKASYLLNFKAV